MVLLWWQGWGGNIYSGTQEQMFLPSNLSNFSSFSFLAVLWTLCSVLQAAEGLGKAQAPSAPVDGSGGALSSADSPMWHFTKQTPLQHWAAKVSLSTTLVAWISKNWEFSFCQGSEVVALYLNQGFHRILFWTVLKQRSGRGEGAFQWCSLRLKEGGGIQNKHMERFPHLNPICSQHWRYSNADRNCTKPHPSGTAEEVWEAVLGSLWILQDTDMFSIPAGNSFLCWVLAWKIHALPECFGKWKQGVHQP